MEILTQQSTKTTEINTTNLVIKPNESTLEKFKKHFVIVRYGIDINQYPKIEQYSNQCYGNLTNQIKEHLNQAFYFYTHEPSKSKYADMGLYVLYPRITFDPEQANFKWKVAEDKESILAEKTIIHDINTVDWHILLKLLLSRFFYDEGSKQVHQSSFHLESKASKSGVESPDYYIALEVKLRHHYTKSSTTVAGEEEFFTIGSTSFFYKASDDEKKTQDKWAKFYAKETIGKLSFFRELKKSEIKNVTDCYKKTRTVGKARVKQHADDYEKMLATKGYLIYLFRKMFIDFIGFYNVEASGKKGYFERMHSLIGKSRGKITEAIMPYNQLKDVHIIDIRLRRTIPTQSYLQRFQKIFKNTNFQELKNQSDIKPEMNLLVLQDTSKKAWEIDKNQKPKGVISKNAPSSVDPYQPFYQKYGDTNPIQFLNVNENDGEKSPTLNAYFEYQLPILTARNLSEELKRKNEELTDEQIEKKKEIKKEQKQAKQWQEKLKVSLNELYLKKIIRHNLPLTTLGNLYSEYFTSLSDYIFIHKNIALCIDQKASLHFYSLADKSKQFKKVIAKFGHKWSEIESLFRSKYLNSNKKTCNAFFIISKNHIVEIQSLDELSLVNYKNLIPAKQANPDGSHRGLDYIAGYQNIWFNHEEKTYIVGDKDAFNNQQEKGQVVRKIDVLKGTQKTFDYNLFMRTLTVPFVKNKNYTVYPFPFKFIREAVGSLGFSRCEEIK